MEQILASGIAEVLIDDSKGLETTSVSTDSASILVQPAAPSPSEILLPAKAPVIRISLSEKASGGFQPLARGGHGHVQGNPHGQSFGRCTGDAHRRRGHRSVLRNSDTLIGLARFKTKDDYIYMHSIAVCDVYDAITSTRAYKAGWEPSHSIRRMAQSRGTHFDFDRRIFDAFVRSLGIYPVGTLVRLESERLGIIIEQTEKLLPPIVKVFFSLRSQTRIPIQVVALSQPGCRDRIVSHEDPQAWQFHDCHALWSGIKPEQVLQGI